MGFGKSVPLLGRAVAAQLVAALGICPTKPTTEIDLGTEAELNYTMADAVRRFGLSASPIANRIRQSDSVADAEARQVRLDLEETAIDG